MPTTSRVHRSPAPCARRALALVAPLALAASALTVAGATPPSAAADRCASQAEYADVERGMTIPGVAKVVGYGGRLDERVTAAPGYVIEKRVYRLCGTRAKVAELGFVSVDDGPFKLTRKTKVRR